MSASAVATFHSRPKVFRPPIHRPPENKAYFGMLRSLLCLGAMLFLVLVISMATQKPATVESESLLSPPVADAAASPVLAENHGKNILLRSGNGIIAGQLARIPGEPEQITEIKAVSDIDNQAGRELLSIISKY